MSKWLDITIHDVNVPHAVGMFAAVSCSLPRFSCVVTAAKIYDTAATSSPNSRHVRKILVVSLAANVMVSPAARHSWPSTGDKTRSKVNRLSTWTSM